MEAQVFTEEMPLYDTRNIFTKEKLLNINPEKLWWNIIVAECNLSACSENIAAAAQINVLNAIVAPLMKKLSNPNKHKFERSKSGIHSDYTVVKPVIMLHDNPRWKQTTLYSVSYSNILLRNMERLFLCET